MDALSPALSIIVYTILIGISFAIAFKALVSLFQNNELDKVSKFIWTAWIISIPIFGSLFYYIVCKPNNRSVS